MSYTFVWENNDAIVAFEGQISLDDIIDANNIIIGDSRFDKMKYQLFDYSNIESLDVDNDFSKIIAALDSRASIWNNSVKVAIVTTDDDFRDMIIEYDKHMNSTAWKTKTFENKDEALKWCRINNAVPKSKLA